MAPEQWRKIPGLPEMYEVSQTGRVRSVDRVTNTSLGPRRYRGRPIKVHRMANKYLGFCFADTGHIGCIALHRALALAFIPNPDDKPCVNHKDGNRLNNALENLEWATYRDNTHHARDVTGVLHVGVRATGAKLTPERVREIRSRHDQSATEIAKEFGVSRRTISNVRNGIGWRHVV